MEGLYGTWCEFVEQVYLAQDMLLVAGSCLEVDEP
jgi:hypothetical protein